MSIHYGVSCDLCRKINFSGRRYKCLICNDFDLCAICYDTRSNVSIQAHSNHHPMQLTLTSNDYERIYFGEIRTQRSPLSLTCSLCNQNGFSLNLLIQHIDEEHASSIHSVLCPVCFLRQENNLSEHLYQHTEENILLKTKAFKQIKTLNSTEKESQPLIKSNEQSLLGKLTDYNHQNENEQRNLFIHSLLTGLVRGKSLN